MTEPHRPFDEAEDVVEDTVDFDVAPPAHVDGALMISFGAVLPGREALAVELFTELSRYLGKLLADEVIGAFKPYFFADGQMGDVIGFFLVDGRRDRLDELRRDESFVRMMLRAGAAVEHVRAQTLAAGSQAGRLVNLYEDVRHELGLI
ncbi:MAG TPA: hypothetical protein VGR90_07860 [Acidimicrobiales bacterium]|nr:hypothetical protein [Acidimicrobiales bacterium]